LQVEIEKLKSDDNKRLEIEFSKRQMVIDNSATEEIIGAKNLEI
jgi:hypothetical protein